MFKFRKLAAALGISVTLAVPALVNASSASASYLSPVARGANAVGVSGDSRWDINVVSNRGAWTNMRQGGTLWGAINNYTTGAYVPNGCILYVYTYRWNSTSGIWDVDTAAPGTRKYGSGDRFNIFTVDRKYWIKAVC
jgi:hypothetical protein